MIKIIDRATDHDEWRAARQQFIGGSDMAAILGISPFKTPLDVWMSKTQNIRTPPTLNMRIGTQLEQLVASCYGEMTGREVEDYEYTFFDDDNHVGGNIDRLTAPCGYRTANGKNILQNAAVLECKTSGRDWGDSGVPAYYLTQVQLYLYLTGCAEADVACIFLTNRRDMRVYHIERDNDMISQMLDISREWWTRHIIEGNAPTPVNPSECARLYPISEHKKCVYADRDISAAVEELRILRGKIADLEQQSNTVETTIKTAMADADTLLSANGKTPLATWRNSRERVNTDYQAAFTALCSEHGITGEQADNYIKRFTETRAGARRFLLK